MSIGGRKLLVYLIITDYLLDINYFLMMICDRGRRLLPRKHVAMTIQINIIFECLFQPQMASSSLAL